MEVSGVVYRPLPRVPGAGIDDHSVYSSFNPSSRVAVGGGNLRLPGSRCRTTVRKSGFSDEGYRKYYCSNSSEIMCGGGKIVEEVKEEKKKMKLMKKRLKLLKGLSKGVDFGLDPENKHADVLLEQIKGNTMMSDTTEQLLTQLRQQLKAEEKELKRKKKEVKAKKKAELVLQKKNKLHCEGASSSSSSSSESSDSECGEVVDMSRLKNQVVPPSPLLHELQLEQSSTVSSTATTVVAEKNLTVCDSRRQEFMMDRLDSGSRVNVAIVGSVNDRPSSVAENKIEVCMGGKCKKSGAASLIEEFNKMLGGGGGGSVVGCKCMGKCRSAPNVRVSNTSSIDQAQIDKATPTKSLCIGVGLDDVRTIVANFLVQTQNDDAGGFAAAAAAAM